MKLSSKIYIWSLVGLILLAGGLWLGKVKSSAAELCFEVEETMGRIPGGGGYTAFQVVDNDYLRQGSSTLDFGLGDTASEYMAFWFDQSASTTDIEKLTINSNFTLPQADGNNTYVMTTNGAGTLAWTAQSGGGGGTFDDQLWHIGTGGQLVNASITSGDGAFEEWIIGDTASATAEWHLDLANQTLNTRVNASITKDLTVLEDGDFDTASTSEATINNTLTVIGSIIGDASEITMADHVVPDGDGTRDLGTAGLKWRSVYMEIADFEDTVGVNASISNDVSITNDLYVGGFASVTGDVSGVDLWGTTLNTTDLFYTNASGTNLSLTDDLTVVGTSDFTGLMTFANASGTDLTATEIWGTEATITTGNFTNVSSTNMSLSDDLYVTGISDFTGLMTYANASGTNLDLADDITVAGTSNFTGQMTAVDASITQITATDYWGTNLILGGFASITGDISGDEYWGVDMTLTGNMSYLNASGTNLSLTDDILVTGTSDFTDLMTMVNASATNVDIADDLYVTGISDFTGLMTVVDASMTDVDIADDLTFINASGTDFTSTEIWSTSGDITTLTGTTLTYNTASMTTNFSSADAGIYLSGYDCSGDANSGNLTVDTNGLLICDDDTAGGGAVFENNQFVWDAASADSFYASTSYNGETVSEIWYGDTASATAEFLFDLTAGNFRYPNASGTNMSLADDFYVTGISDFTGDATFVNASMTDLTTTNLWGTIGLGAFDFGEATFEIPNAANPVVDAVGEMALDTTDLTLQLFDGTAERVFAHATSTMTGNVASTSDAWVSDDFCLGQSPSDMGITLSELEFCTTAVGDDFASLTVELQHRATMGGAGTSILFDTFDTTEACNATSTFSDATIPADSWICMVTTTDGASGTVGYSGYKIDFYKDVE